MIVIAFSLLSATALGAAPPPVPATLQDHENPVLRRVETRYTCRDGERRFTLVYRQGRRPVLERAVRRGVRLRPAQLEQAKRAVARLDGVTAVTPQCSGPNDLLIVVGVVGRQRSAVFINWSAAAIQATEPQPVGF